MKRISIAAALVAGLIFGTGVLAQFETRTSTAGGVTIKVTPKLLAPESAAWELAVVLDSHTQDLSDDLSKTAAMVGANGVRRSPTSWVGAGPGGHHREGVLGFEAIKPRPAAIELQIQRTGEDAPRSFRWDLK